MKFAIFFILSLPLLSIEISELVEVGINNNFDIRTSDNKVRISKADNDQKSLELFIPRIDLSLNRYHQQNNKAFYDQNIFSYEEQTSYQNELKLSYKIFEGLKTYYQKKKSSIDLDVSRLNHQEKIQVYLYNLKKAYLLYSASKNKLNVYKDILENDKKLFTVAQKKYQAGGIVRNDFLLSEITLLQTNKNVSYLKSQTQVAINDMKSVIGTNDINIESLSALDYTTISSNNFVSTYLNESPDIAAKHLAKLMRSNSPSIKSLQYQKLSSSIEVDIAKSSFYPQVEIQGLYQYNIDSEVGQRQNTQKDNAIILLNVTFPLISNFETYFDTKRANLSKINQEINYQKALHESDIELENELTSLKALYNNFLLSLKENELRKNIYKNSIQRFSRGAIPIRDAIQDRNEYNNNLIELIDLHYQIEFSILNVLRKTGQVEV